MTKDFEALAKDAATEAKNKLPYGKWTSGDHAFVRGYLEGAHWGREAGLDEAAGIAVDKGKSVNGGYNNAAWEIAEAIRAAKGK